MTQEVAYRFIEALADLEQRGQIDPILDTFSEACDVASSSSPEPLQGKRGAWEYWDKYRAAFRDIQSTITNIITGDDSIALEWTTTATDRSGKEVQYSGVSIIDTRGPAIVRFRAYFDTKHLTERILPQQAHSSVQNNLRATASGA
jgi:ketosteroid isomerase-like protein